MELGVLIAVATFIGCVERIASSIKHHRKQHLKSLVRQCANAKLIKEIKSDLLDVKTMLRKWAAKEERRPDIQARWDARRDRMRMERNTAPALGASRRAGRL